MSEQKGLQDRAVIQLVEALGRLAKQVAPYGELRPALPAETWAAKATADMLSDDRDLSQKTAWKVMALVATSPDKRLADEIGIPPERWWTTPLGAVCSMGLSRDRDDHSVTVPQAQEILGVSRARIYQLLDEGKLERVEDGVSFTSLMRRLRWLWRNREDG